MNKEEIANNYFGGCKPKELQIIKYETPQGNNVEAFICRKPNKYLGSLYIYKVNEKDTSQFVPSMPKIHYLDNYHMPTVPDDEVLTAHEKLDGTCIILYVLKDHNGESLEIVPKSRGMGVLDKQFLKKYERIDTLYIEEYLKNHPSHVLLFELYGMGNIHSIEHMDTYLKLGFIGYYDNLGDLYHENTFFSEIPVMFTIEKYYDKLVLKNYGLKEKYFYYVKHGAKTFNNINECISDIQDQLEELNKKYYEVNHRLALEGVVLNYFDSNLNSKYLKIKPYSIEKEHRSEGGIPRQYLMKEVMKYLDEYGSIAKMEYEKDKNHYLSYMKRQLLEEFDELAIDKSEKKMLQYLEKRLYPQTDKDLEQIADKLISDYPNKEVVDYIRIFAQEYPSIKKKSRKMYSLLEERTL